MWHCVVMGNSLPRNKVSDWTKLKAFSIDISVVAQRKISVFRRVGNLGRGENAGYRHFPLFLLCFKRLCIHNG